MKTLKSLFVIGCVSCINMVNAQIYPNFGPEKSVTINGLTFDAMEPFISPDNSKLFFNNLNDGVNTKLFYADRVNDSVFTFVGEVVGANQLVNPQLDAVADMDNNNQFYWTSTRDYPAELDNLHYGTFTNGIISDSGRVHGDFNMNIAGWLVMDHGINYNGQYLYFNNARFDNANCQGPCETQIGVAQRVNDSIFNKLTNSSGILQNINDPNYIYYAPCITADDLEFYYTRYLSGTIVPGTMFEVCVAVRSTPTDSFSIPQVLFSDSIAYLVEAPTLTTDKLIMYYHRKVGSTHEIKMRHRLSSVGYEENIVIKSSINLFPNPMTNEVTISFSNTTIDQNSIRLIDSNGKVIKTFENLSENNIIISRENLTPGIYYIQIYSQEGVLETKKLIVN